jgi:hypothetical protein
VDKADPVRAACLVPPQGIDQEADRKMSMAIDSRKLVLVFILLTPIVGNLNGFIFWRTGVFSIGPVFYTAMLGALCLALLSLRFERKVLLNNYFIFAAIVAWYAFHAALYGGALESFRFFIKFFMPFLFYRFLNLYYGEDRRLILDYLGKTVVIWSAMAILTATLRIKPSAGEGYYGFIHGNNDYVVMMFALYPFAGLWRSRVVAVMYLIALLLTRSKGLVLLGGMMFLQQRSKTVKIFAAITLALTVSYYIHYFQSNYLSGSGLTWYQLAHFASFGRVATFIDLIEGVKLKSPMEHILGSGIQGSFLITKGKGNVEMDIPDVYNIFGLAGMVLVAWFYYGGIWKHRSMTRKTKLNFLPLFRLSALGGHFFFNTVSNVVFAMLLFLSREPGLENVAQPEEAVKPAESANGNLPG